MVKLEKGAAAAAALGAHERTLAAIARPDSSPDGSGNVSCPLGPVAPRARPVGRRPLALFGRLDQKRERLVEDRGHITIGDLVTKEVLSETQTVVRLLVDSELEQILARSQRSDDDRRRRCRPQRRQLLLDFALAAVTRVCKQGTVVVIRKHRTKQSNRRECQRASRKKLEDDGIFAASTGRFDPRVSGVLGEAQHFSAIAIQRVVTGGEVKTSVFDLRQRSDQCCRGFAVCLRIPCRRGEEFRIRKMGRRDWFKALPMLPYRRRSLR